MAARSLSLAAAAFGSPPLSTSEVTSLGVDVPSFKLLVEQAPECAVGLFAYRILEVEPAFAAQLTHEQLHSLV